MKRIVNLFDLPVEERKNYAEEISAITNREEKMLSISPDEVLSRRFIALMLGDRNEIISMISIFHPETNRDGFWLAEVGMMYTDERFRGQGLGHEMYVHAERWAKTRDEFDGFVVFLCEASIGIFAEAGFSAEDAEKVLPGGFFEICLDHCLLNPDAEKQAQGDAGKLAEIHVGREKARREFQDLYNKYKSLGKKGARQLEILRANAHRAGLCCPLPAHKIFRF